MSTLATNGSAIRALRERSGYSVPDLVEVLIDQESVTVHEDHLRNVETGARNAGPRLAAAISRVLRVPIAAILAVPEPVLENGPPTSVESVNGQTWSVVAVLSATCRCGWSCAEHDDEKVATFCARSHAANCSVGLGVESHDSAVRNHLLDVWGERP